MHLGEQRELALNDELRHALHRGGDVGEEALLLLDCDALSQESVRGEKDEAAYCECSVNAD